jgi:hypothetical protein
MVRDRRVDSAIQRPLDKRTRRSPAAINFSRLRQIQHGREVAWKIEHERFARIRWPPFQRIDESLGLITSMSSSLESASVQVNDQKSNCSLM